MKSIFHLRLLSRQWKRVRLAAARILSRAPFRSDYLHPRMLQFIDDSRIHTVVELGARDGRDALALRDYFNVPVITFECNPEAISLCRAKLDKEPGVTLVELAAWHETGSIDFFPVIHSSYPDGSPTTDLDGRDFINIGASSCFRARSDYLEQYEQSRIRVPATRLDEYFLEHPIESIDLMCIDLQGAALNALKGLGKLLDGIQYLVIELEFRALYHDQPLYLEVREFLESAGFCQRAEYKRDAWFSDFLFTR